MGLKLCTVDDCERKVLARGWCSMHYARWRHHGDTLSGVPAKQGGYRPRKYRTVEDCDKHVTSRGYCQKHYARWFKHGDPLALKIAERGTGNITVHGYRRLMTGGRLILEHRLVMEQVLNRRLGRHETVHHKNGDRLDNRPENLELHVGNHAPGATEAHCHTCTCFEH